MKILVIGGMHGNELLGVRIVQLLQESPIVNVDSCIANPRAVEQKRRFIETDLNRSFGSNELSSYEEQRALELANMISAYDLVLDFHNTETANNNTCFVGEARMDGVELAATYLGFSNGIEATYNCINKYCSNTLSVEISVGDKLDDAMYWYSKVAALAQRIQIPKSKNDMQWYRFLRRVTWQERQELGIEGWMPFTPLSNQERQLLGIDKLDVAPIFIGSTLTQYYATLIYKLPMLAK